MAFDERCTLDKDLFSKSLDLMAHRGPDDSGVLHVDNLLLGHRRLSIIDLKAHSRQPMVSDCGNYVVVFNGEIYNYNDIKPDLVRKGYKFRTNSDTEVLLNSFIEYGIDCVEKFIGMFAFSIYDKTNHASYIVRDRLGVKPLYYYSDQSQLIFSSEIKSILSLGKINRQLNKKAVSSYLSFRYPILDDTFFDGVYSIPPGCYMKVEGGNYNIKQYWNPSELFKEQNNDKGEEYYKKKLKELLESSVKYRMISDVPFGAFLSGGVDSSIVAGLMSEMSDEKIKTFTIGFEEEGYNEYEYAKLISDKFDTAHHEITVSARNYLETMEELIHYKDAPLSVPNEVPLYLMSKELKKYITVVLSGEGADEIFGGYGRIFRSPYDLERIQKLDELVLSDEDKRKFVKNFVRKYLVEGFDSEIDHFMNIYSYTSYNCKKDLLHESIDLESYEQEFVDKFLSYFDELKGESYFNKMVYAFEKVHIVGLLQRLDMTTMAASVEGRVPFVDHRLVEFAFTVPMKYKLKWKSDQAEAECASMLSDEISEVYDTPKYLLKKAYEGFIPDEVLYRKKMGFPVPLNKWFGGDFNEYARSVLLTSKADKRKLYNLELIKKLLESGSLRDNHSLGMKIWMLVNIEMFCEAYLG